LHPVSKAGVKDLDFSGSRLFHFSLAPAARRDLALGVSRAEFRLLMIPPRRVA
jgi:hypothetical protein